MFSSYGSGTLQGVPTYWSEQCVFYPTAFCNETVELIEKDKCVSKPIIYVNAKTPVTTPFDVFANVKENNGNKHGSCGVGFGKTLEREERYYSLLVEDLQFPTVLRQKLRLIQQYYGAEISDEDFWDFVTDCLTSVEYIHIVHGIDELQEICDSVIYEGSQGLMLDKDIGYFPHVTRANVGSKVIKDNLDRVFYITRAYQTRHGNGPMSNQELGHNIKENPNETNVSNYQGEFRRSILDLDILRYTIYKDNTHAEKKTLVITCLDHVENEWRFTHNAEVIYSASKEEFVEKICKTLGFNDVYISESENYDEIERIKYDV